MSVSQTNSINKNVILVGAATATLGNNVLNTTAGATANDLMSTPFGGYFKTLQVQLTCSAALSAGQIFFEGSNDNINFTEIQASELVYEWTGLSYTNVNYPFGGTNPTYRTFKMNVEGFRYVRARVTIALVGGTITAHQVWSQTPYTINRALPSASRLQNATTTSMTTATTMINGAGTNLKNYFVKATICDGGVNTAKDIWVTFCATGTNTAPAAGNTMIGVFASSTTSAESGDVFSPIPLPSPVNTGMGIYINSGSNIWASMWYFVAP
jgi:hypothetical protein